VANVPVAINKVEEILVIALEVQFLDFLGHRRPPTDFDSGRSLEDGCALHGKLLLSQPVADSSL
jgi:hypothetical protein